MLAGWRSRRSGQMRQIRFDTRAVPAFFFCSSTTSPPHLFSLLSSSSPSFSSFSFASFFSTALSFSYLEVRLAKEAQLERAGRIMQMPTITERQSGRKLTSGDMAAGSLHLLLVFFFFSFAFFSKRRRSEESGANKRPRLYKLRETDDGAAARGRARSSRH